MSRRYHSREAVCVGIPNIAGKYGFMTNLTAANQTSLGITEIGSTGIPVFFGASRPKPPRARNESDGVSSFWDSGLVPVLPDGWKIAAYPKSPARQGGLEKTTLVYINIGGSAKYMWRIPVETLTKIADDSTGLGISPATGSDKGFLGANWILEIPGYEGRKPPRAKKKIAGEGGTDIISTFCAPDKLDSLPDGWQPIN